jgi:hypothetical protein
MERNFTNENFERFLRQNAEGLRMHASDRVWKGISKRLNRRRRRIGFVLSLSLLAVSSLGYYLMNDTVEPASQKMAGSVPRQTIAVSNEPVKNIGQDTKQTLAVNKNLRQNTQNSINGGFLASRAGIPLSAFNAAYANSLISENEFTPTIVDSYDEVHTKAASPVVEKSKEHPTYPMTIESVVNSYIPTAKKSKLSWQIYFTPTVSYRKLSENKTYQQSVPLPNAPLSYLYNINSVVTHKPDFGFEIGFAAKYAIAKDVKLRAGLQFNINRYDIKAFSSPTQLATIRLNDRNGVDQVNTVTNYNNFGGYKTNWLENFYFQVSAPVGVEVRLRGDDKMAFGLASTIQPTYVLGDRAYLISTDYKNYAEVPWLIRRWNVNTNLETFVAYSTGHLKWQVGPQVRYQLLSSFVKKYPVKENLFDFGLKVGVSLNNHQ